MKIEKQVCSFVQAKKLKELGIDQKGYFTYLECEKGADFGTTNEWYPMIFSEYRGDMEMVGEYPSGMTFGDFGEDNEFYSTGGKCSAFSVAELGAMFSVWTDNEDSDSDSDQKLIDELEGRYGDKISNAFNPFYIADGLIYAIENKLITPASCNDKLNFAQ